MSEYTPITGELRELLADINWTKILDHVHTNGGGICDGDWLDHWHEQAEHVCDAIDAIHAQLERENESLKAELDRVLGEQDNSATMPLPLDIDGKPIRIGDVMEWYDGETFEVVGIGGGVLFYVKDGHEQADWTGASTKRHHAPDTWERIIEDARTCTGSAGNYTSVPSMRWTNEVDALVARCKALCERTKEGA